MSAPRTINGIGKGTLIMSASGATPEITIELPLTMQGGYSETWDDETITHRLIGLDISNRTIEEVQCVIDGFGNWLFDYSGIPLPRSVINDFVLIWNERDDHTMTLKPKSQNYIGTPERSFIVNFIGAEGLDLITGDSAYSPGTFGVKLRFRTKTNQKIVVADPIGIGATLNYSYGDDSFEEVLYTT